MNNFIVVKFKYYSTGYTINKVLLELENRNILSLDFETQPIYTLDERAEAKELVKKYQDELSSKDLRLSKVVANCSGLSHPSITKVTHVIFGLSNKESIVLIINNKEVEQLVMDWITNFKGKFIVHNSLFDLKIVHHRTEKFPIDFDDTQLIVRTLINHTKDWECRTGLKHLIGQDYDPKWTLIESYDIQDFKNKDFLRYCAIDGAATFKLWEDIQEILNEQN